MHEINAEPLRHGHDMIRMAPYCPAQTIFVSSKDDAAACATVLSDALLTHASPS